MKDAFLQGMSRAANSVCVVTTDGDAGRAGVTISAMTSVSVDTPKPTLLVCIHTLSPACDAILKNGVFCANLLGSDQAHVSNSFAGRTGAKGIDKFACADWATRKTGAPLLQDALAQFDCTVVHETIFGSHRMFVGEVEYAVSQGFGDPLLYFQRDYAIPMRMSS
jgi:flavin reductase